MAEYQTHRCERVLENGTPIRKDYKTGLFGGLLDRNGWCLYDMDFDYEYDCWHINFIAQIKYCPYCGVELGEENING